MIKSKRAKRLNLKLGYIRHVMAISTLAVLLQGCGGGGSSSGETTLPTDNALNLYCPDEGINRETCVLSNPENPFARSLVDDGNKFTLSDAAPSAKSRYYVWATALARSPSGENQYYTALALHQLFTAGGSEVAREQAKRAYRSLLDNFFDSQLFSLGGAQLDFIPDTDFIYSDFGSGTADNGWDGGYTGDPDFSPVWSLPDGKSAGWGTALAFTALPAGFGANYENLVFKVKDFPTDTIFVQFVGGGGDSELSFSVSASSTDIAGTTGWKQVTIPLSGFANRAVNTAFSIHDGGAGNGNPFFLTDIGFTGDSTGSGLVNDVDNNGTVFFYRSGSQLYARDTRNDVGQQLYSPEPSLLQLYINQTDAMNALNAWGYQYDPGTNVLTRLP